MDWSIVYYIKNRCCYAFFYEIHKTCVCPYIPTHRDGFYYILHPVAYYERATKEGTVLYRYHTVQLLVVSIGWVVTLK